MKAWVRPTPGLSVTWGSPRPGTGLHEAFTQLSFDGV